MLEPVHKRRKASQPNGSAGLDVMPSYAMIRTSADRGIIMHMLRKTTLAVPICTLAFQAHAQELNSTTVEEQSGPRGEIGKCEPTSGKTVTSATLRVSILGAPYFAFVPRGLSATRPNFLDVKTEAGTTVTSIDTPLTPDRYFARYSDVQINKANYVADSWWRNGAPGNYQRIDNPKLSITYGSCNAGMVFYVDAFDNSGNKTASFELGVWMNAQYDTSKVVVFADRFVIP